MTSPFNMTAAKKPSLRKLHLSKPRLQLLCRDQHLESSSRFAQSHACIWHFTVLLWKKLQNRLMNAICKPALPAANLLLRYHERFVNYVITPPNTDGIVNCSSAGLTNPATMTNKLSLPGLISLCNGFLQSHPDSFTVTSRSCSFAGIMQKPITGDWQLTIPPSR